MIKELQLRVSPEVANDADLLKRFVSKSIRVGEDDIHHIDIQRRSVDARGKKPVYNLKVAAYIGEVFPGNEISLPDYPDVSNAPEAIIIGSGPAGLFAALHLLEKGIKPVILERGKDVRSRIADLKNINVRHIVNEDSNYCFGEGGAGTYSDGKLYTRSKKRGNVRLVLERLVGFGAVNDILVDAHPHIGTNKLPGIIASMRKCILSCGGEIRFGTRVTDLIVSAGAIKGVKTLGGETIPAQKVILATGHSARDIFELFQNKGLEIHLKPLAIGVRVEHPQSLIDTIQYNCADRGAYLPPSSYNIVKQVNGRGVYSFCMCPGGVIAPCATRQEEIVTNGWSSSKRARATANSGIVVELRPEDFAAYHHAGALAAMEFQKEIEHKAWIEGGRTQRAPAQLLCDFIDGKTSVTLPKTSYAPGIAPVDLASVLPGFILDALRGGFRQIGHSMKGYLTNDAVVHAPETRTSSPVSIPRDPETLEHPGVAGLYPCGEGAGYAGGIVSAALDGIRCAEACAVAINK